ELRVVARRQVHEPAPAGRVVVDADRVRRRVGQAEVGAAQVGDGDTRVPQHVQADGVQTGGGPAVDRRGENGFQVGGGEPWDVRAGGGTADGEQRAGLRQLRDEAVRAAAAGGQIVGAVGAEIGRAVEPPGQVDVAGAVE